MLFGFLFVLFQDVISDSVYDFDTNADDPRIILSEKADLLELNIPFERV